MEKESLLPEDIVTITRWLDEHPDVVANYCEKDYVPRRSRQRTPSQRRTTARWCRRCARSSRRSKRA